MSPRFSSLAATTIFALACSQPQREVARPVVSAPIEVVRSARVDDVRITTGTVRAATSATLASKILGNVTRVLVSEGDRVHAGDVLVEIDARDVRAKVEQARAGARALDDAIAAAAAGIVGAEANVKFADATYVRFAALRERGSASPHEFEEVTARRNGARAELDRARRGRDSLTAQRAQALASANEAETLLSETRVRSPFDGIVSARFVDAGAQAAPGVPLIAIENASQYRVETFIADDLATRIRPGDDVQVDGVIARVEHVAPVDARTRTALVKIALPAATALRSGAFVHVAFPVGARDAITLPLAAIARRGELASVYVVNGSGVAHMRLITASEPRNGRVEVLSGLEAGEHVVSTASGVVDGTRVRSAS